MEGWKKVYDDMSYFELRAMKAAFEADLQDASEGAAFFIQSRLKYIKERLPILSANMARCGDCVYFKPYDETPSDVGRCEIGGRDSAMVGRDLLSHCVSFRPIVKEK